MVKTKINKECKRMSPKRKHKKKYRKDESSDIHVEDKQYEKRSTLRMNLQISMLRTRS
jgi:hypothetical protein